MSIYFLKSCYSKIVPGVLMYEESGYKYYKVPVAYGTRMNLGVVTDTCEAQGMKSVCFKSGCRHNSDGCRVTPLSTNCNVPLVGLAQTLCADRWMGTGRWRPWYCPNVDGIFTDHLSTLRYGTKGQGACGYNYEVNRGCRYNCCLSGDDYVSSETAPLYAYCVL